MRRTRREAVTSTQRQRDAHRAGPDDTHADLDVVTASAATPSAANSRTRRSNSLPATRPCRACRLQGSVRAMRRTQGVSSSVATHNDSYFPVRFCRVIARTSLRSVPSEASSASAARACGRSDRPIASSSRPRLSRWLASLASAMMWSISSSSATFAKATAKPFFVRDFGSCKYSLRRTGQANFA